VYSIFIKYVEFLTYLVAPLIDFAFSQTALAYMIYLISHTQTTTKYLSNNPLTLSPGNASIKSPAAVFLPCGPGPVPAFAAKLFKIAYSTASLAARNTASTHSFFVASSMFVSTTPCAIPALKSLYCSKGDESGP
jgi:hypothetical protein